MDKLVSYFQNMKTEEMVLFITIVVCLVVLIIMAISLASKNAELRKIITKLSKEKEEQNKKDAQPLDLQKEKSEPRFVLGRETIAKQEEVKPSSNLYTKNVLNEVGTKDQTSPIAIGKKTYEEDYHFSDDIQKLEPIEILDEESADLDDEDNVSFVEEISKQIEKDLEPQTIDLTDFERKQEEDAIISYEELIKNKNTRQSRYASEEELLNQDNTYQFTTEDDEEFLKELKSFRNDL